MQVPQDYRNPASTQRPCFTLLELLVVMALMSVAVGLVVFRLDGLTENGRLQSAAYQFASIVRLAENEARLSGTPRLLEYALDQDGVRLRKPREVEGVWEWDPGTEFQTATGVAVKDVIREHSYAEHETERIIPVRIQGDGRWPRHAVVLDLHQRFAVLFLEAGGTPRVIMSASPPSATCFHELRALLENDRGPR